MSGQPLVLASRSAARAALLTAAGVAFHVKPSDVDEAQAKLQWVHDPPRQIAVKLADAKAVEVSRRCEGLVLAADQTLDLGGRLLSQPGSKDGLRRQLLALQGRTHTLHAAAALARDGQVVWRHVDAASLSMRTFSDEFLDAYLAQADAGLFACVGGYRLEGLGVQLFDAIEGDYFTVLGLPLTPLLSALRAEGMIAT